MRMQLVAVVLLAALSTVAASSLQPPSGGAQRLDVAAGSPTPLEASWLDLPRAGQGPVRPGELSTPDLPRLPGGPDGGLALPGSSAPRSAPSGAEEPHTAPEAPRGWFDTVRTAGADAPPTVWWSMATLAVGSFVTKLWWIGPGRLTWAAERLFRLGLVLPLWTMLTGQSLENRNRLIILAFLGKHPGASIRDVQAHAGVAWGTVVYHLDRLTRDGKVVSHRSGNHHRYWLNGTPEAKLRHGWAVLEQPTTRQIARAVAGTPGIHQAAICQVAGVRPPSASKHLARLERLGLVATQRVSRYTVYEPTEELQRILALHDGSGIDTRPTG